VREGCQSRPDIGLLTAGPNSPPSPPVPPAAFAASCICKRFISAFVSSRVALVRTISFAAAMLISKARSPSASDSAAAENASASASCMLRGVGDNAAGDISVPPILPPIPPPIPSSSPTFPILPLLHARDTTLLILDLLFGLPSSSSSSSHASVSVDRWRGRAGAAAVPPSTSFMPFLPWFRVLLAPSLSSTCFEGPFCAPSLPSSLPPMLTLTPQQLMQLVSFSPFDRRCLACFWR
jgi:hypothetical protein